MIPIECTVCLIFQAEMDNHHWIMDDADAKPTILSQNDQVKGKEPSSTIIQDKYRNVKLVCHFVSCLE
jgi:hypothetical protein